MKSTIQRAKKSGISNPGFKHEYSSVEALAEHLKSFPSLLTTKHGNVEVSICAELVKSYTKHSHLILYDEELLNKFDQQNDMFTDATFTICPNVKGVIQVLTIMCKKFNIVSLSYFQTIKIYK